MANDERRIADSGLLLGAHVSSAGGLGNAPIRGGEIGATAVQLFTKMPSRWAERVVEDADAVLFREGRAEKGIGFACAHDSYLINLATPDETLRERSFASFRSELERSGRLGLDAIVTHPGNATDGEMERGLAQNASMIQRALEETEDGPRVLLEITAGSGRVLGSTFEELAQLRAMIDEPYRDRVGICFDTCHAFAAGYDLIEDYEGVMERFDRVIGLEHLEVFHMNDSKKPLGSRRDRHAEIGEGELGLEPFRSIMNDPRFGSVPKILETPKGDDYVVADRRNLGRLMDLLEG